MFKNIFKSMFFVSLTICCFLNKYVSGEVENSKIDQVKSQKRSVENTYYKEHSSEFIKQKLITKVSQAIGFKKKIAVNLLLLLCDAAILGTVFSSSYSISKVCGVNEGYYNHRDPEHSLIISLIFTILTLSFIPAFHISLYQYIYNNKLYSEEELQGLIKILDKYDPDMQMLGCENNKNCIPKGLAATFDGLWSIYQQGGKDGLKREWNKIRESVVGKGDRY